MAEALFIRRRQVAVFTLMLLCAPAFAGGADSARPIPVPPPPMGWSSWNSFSDVVDSEIVMAQARAMVLTP